MIRNRVSLVLLLAPGLLGLASICEAAELRTVAKPIEGQYIVVLKPDAARLAGERSRAPLIDAVGASIAAEHGARLTQQYHVVLRGFAVRADDHALAKLLADPRIAYVQEDGVFHAVATQTGAPWGLDRVDQRDLPFDQNYTYTTTASGVHAYVIDTGIYAGHSQFTGRIGSGYTAYATGGTDDCNGHGTHVAGIIGGGTYGVAKGVTLHPVRVLDCNGTGATSSVVGGLDWVARNRVNPAVANMSLAGATDTTLNSAVGNLINAGVTVVVAAGNNATNAQNTSPANLAAAITVGSVRRDDGRSQFSNYGSVVDVFAPGSSILSAYRGGTTATAVMSGTSMAAPHVTGFVALYLASHPTATPSQVATAMVQSATPLRVLAATPTSGDGTPNRLLFTLGGSVAAPPTAPPPTITGYSCPGSGGVYTCTVSYSSASRATVEWPDDTIGVSFSRSCVKGETVTVPVLVGNAFGVAKTTRTFSCPSGPAP